ncbi:DUF1800 domain-containing protein [Neolewinella antarctica]|uniref:DUF1800 domain-containing protein n=1 Tax=Neolewinella antarctica TaxID=442734 RepID=A0ABX0XBM8_9BACT|nr:DUF1800 family protein [Neolewinella antarctica]NJC26649.1 hypothetical protein [Neolewinella antarctica]
MKNLLAPYSGPWDARAASHLLRRTILGPTFSEIKSAVDDGLQKTVARLLDVQAPPPPPLLHRPETEPDVKVGETWVDRPHPSGGGAYRGQSLDGWFYGWLTDAPFSLQSQMVFFWLNHFGMDGVRDGRSMYRFIKMLQSDYLGNVKKMIKVVTIEPAMLEFLDGEENSKRSPNENYGRELLELFTIQKGKQRSEGDYSTYTEQDVIEIARALTGWTNEKFEFADDDTPVASYFDPVLHDTDDKQLSRHFDNAVISSKGSGKNEYSEIIDIIFSKRETSRAFCRQIYRFFVHSDISKNIEKNVIEPLTDTLIASNFELSPVIERLLSSSHFYHHSVSGVKIKNPNEFIVGMLRSFEWPRHVSFESLQQEYTASVKQANFCSDMEMDFNGIPEVAGWAAYYQAPTYYRLWISPASLKFRQDAMLQIINPYYHISQHRTPINWRNYLETLTDASILDDVISDASIQFLSRKLTSSQVAELKDVILGEGTDDDVWTMEYDQYVQDDDSSMATSFEQRLYDFFRAMFGMLEFQLH